MRRYLDVSVVIPYFNAAETIIAAIQSVYEQTVEVLEVIIVDDGSDKCPVAEILALNMQQFATLRIITLAENHGVSHARNVGVRLAKGEFIAFLDADDCWHPAKLEIQVGVMKQLNAVFSAHGYSSRQKDWAEECIKNTPAFNSYWVPVTRMLWGNVFFTPTVICQRNVLLPFDEQLSRLEDYHCWFRILHEHGPALMLDLCLAHGRKSAIGEAGLSGSVSKMHEGMLGALFLLRKDKFLGLLSYFVAFATEMLKYPLRCIRVWLRKLKC